MKTNDGERRLHEATAQLYKHVDRLQIIIESINREGGFAALTASWPRADTIAFCEAIVAFGELFRQRGHELLHALGCPPEERHRP